MTDKAVALPGHAGFIKNNLRNYGMLLSLFAIMLFFQVMTDGTLLQPLNLTNLVLQNSYIVIMALGMLLIIVTGHIDLSVGSVLGISAFPEDHPLHLGMPGMHGEVHVNRAIQHADLLIAVGMRFDDRVTGNTAGFARHAKIVHIELDPTEIGKNVPVESDGSPPPTSHRFP